MVPGFQRSPDLGGQLTSGEHMTREAEVVALRKAFSLPPVPTAMDAMSFPPSLCCGVEQSRAFSWSRRLSSSPSPLLSSSLLMALPMSLAALCPPFVSGLSNLRNNRES